MPLFKGKCAKVNNKSNYRGITLFPTLSKFTKWCFSTDLITILETINHMLESFSKVFGCFLDVRKAFYIVWVDCLLYKLFSEFGIRGRMWLAIKDLYSGVRAQVLYSCSLSKTFDISQGTGQGRILAPFMYKVYINGFFRTLTQHSCALSINSLRLTSPSFADDISLLALYPTFLRTFTNTVFKWRYEFNYVKIGILTFGEAKCVHC